MQNIATCAEKVICGNQVVTALLRMAAAERLVPSEQTEPLLRALAELEAGLQGLPTLAGAELESMAAVALEAQTEVAAAVELLTRPLIGARLLGHCEGSCDCGANLRGSIVGALGRSGWTLRALTRAA